MIIFLKINSMFTNFLLLFNSPIYFYVIVAFFMVQWCLFIWTIIFPPLIFVIQCENSLLSQISLKNIFQATSSPIFHIFCAVISVISIDDYDTPTIYLWRVWWYHCRDISCQSQSYVIIDQRNTLEKNSK